MPKSSIQDAPSELNELHKNVRLFIDVLCVNRTPFLHAMSEKLGVRLLQVFPNQLKELLLCFAQEAMNLYQNHNFNINIIDVNLEIDSIKNPTGITMSIFDIESHIHPAECSTRTSKERMCCLLQGLYFSCIPKDVIVGTIIDCTNNLNRLPRNNYITEYSSPSTIVVNEPKLDFNLLTLSFSEHVEMHEDNGFQTSSTNMRGTSEMNLYSVWNYTGRYELFSLFTGTIVLYGS